MLIRLILFVVSVVPIIDPAFAAEVLYQYEGGSPLHLQTSTVKGSFTGMLPVAWSENFTHFSEAVVKSEVREEDGVRHLRITVLKPGQVQFLLPLPEMKLKAWDNLRLTVVSRNTTSTSLSFAVRQWDTPYRSYWANTGTNNATWKTNVDSFRLPDEEMQPQVLMLYLQGGGNFDLAGIKLERLTPEEAAGQVWRPAPQTPNFFRNSRFPLGMQNGWSLGRDYTTGDIRSDSANPGPSGAPALCMESSDPLTVYSEPFQTATPNVINHVGLAVKGSGKWSIVLRGIDGREFIRRELVLTDAWSDMTLDYPPDPVLAGMLLEFRGTGKLLLDSLQAWAGNGERRYQSAGECEVALAPAASPLAGTRIQFADEPASIQYCVTGAVEGAALRLRVFNIYGAMRELPAVMLRNEAPSGLGVCRGTVDYAVFPEAKIGQFRMEAQIERAGVAVSPYNELVMTRLERPRYWGKDAPSSPFGCHFLPSPPVMQAMKAAGVNWVRLHDAGLEYTGWFWLEPEKGQWRFRDEAIQSYRSQHIRIYAQLGTAPKWASYLSKVDTGRSQIEYHDRYFVPLQLSDFGNYAATVTGRYAGVIDEYFIWNEPWVPSWWGKDYDKTRAEKYITSPNAPAEYAAMMQVAYSAGKKADSRTRIAGFNTTVGAHGERWTDGVFKANGLANCDIVDFHYYTSSPVGFPEDSITEEVRKAVGELRQQPGFTKPVYMSEGQPCSTGSAVGSQIGRTGLYTRTLPWNNREDYQYSTNQLSCYLIRLLSERVDRVFLYSAHCYNFLGGDSNFLTLLNSDGYPHPMLVAHAQLARMMEDKKFYAMTKMADGVYAYVFEGTDGAVAAILGSGHTILPEIPGSVVSDLYGNPVTTPVTSNGQVLYLASDRPANVLLSLLKAK